MLKGYKGAKTTKNPWGSLSLDSAVLALSAVNWF